MKQIILLSLCFLLVLSCQNKNNDNSKHNKFSTKNTNYRTDSLWAKEYQNRLNKLLYAQTFKFGKGRSDPDAGKRTWPLLLAEMYKVKEDTQKLLDFINKEGDTLLNSQWAGNFCKPFTLPGYTMYYFRYKDLLSPEHHAEVKRTLYTAEKSCVDTSQTGWEYLMRPDGYMDPIYGFTEFNSENFNWMARMGGYLFAHEFQEKEKLKYYENYIRNWIRTLYNVGRLEWNSINYWGHCFNPIMSLYVNAKDTSIKKMAKAGLDWMLVEASLHYIDGFQAGGDVRAKNIAFIPFAGSVWGYAYLYFAAPDCMPTYQLADSNKEWNFHLNDFVGYAPYSDYRPPKVVVDIAQRKFKLPVEIRSAKPYYLVDNNNYADWKGATENSKKYEFETMYYDDNYLLASLASNRPDGNYRYNKKSERQQMPFCEESIWRLAVKGSNNGALQIFGNTERFKHLAGRDPHEEVGQYRNVMMRLMKNTGMSWIVLPREMKREMIEDKLFVDLGHGVYAAFIPYNSNKNNSEEYIYGKKKKKQEPKYDKYHWYFDKEKLSAIVLEVGTKRQWQSFEQFKEAVLKKTTLTRQENDILIYKSAENLALKMQYMPTIAYKTVTGRTIEPAGVTPKIWQDGKPINYSEWNSYEVSYGQKIIHQAWGSGELHLESNTNKLKIRVNPENANVTYTVPDNK